MLLEIDAVGLVRRPGQGLEQYVNDRPYAASSFFTVAMNQVFKEALLRKCKTRPELVEQPLQLQAELEVVRCPSGADYLRGLFAPLGYEVEAREHPLDPQFGWDHGPYFSLVLRACCPLHQLLNHLYILLPVLDQLRSGPALPRGLPSLLLGYAQPGAPPPGAFSPAGQ